MTIELLFDLLRSLNIILLGFTACLGFLRFKKLALAGKFLALYFDFLLIVEVTAEILAWNTINNLKLLYAYALVEILFLGLLFTSLFKKNGLLITSIVSYIIIIDIFIMICYEGFTMLVSEEVSLYSKGLSNIVIILFSSFFIMNQIKNNARFYTNSFFKINTSILIYFTISFIVFLLFNELITIDKQYFIVIWGINNLLAMCFYWISFNYFKSVGSND